MKKIVFGSMFAFMLTGCFAQTVDLTKYHNDTYVTCKSKLDNSELDYLQSQKTETTSTLMPNFKISNIVDIRGKHWSVNQIEWNNYDCVQKKLP